MITGAVVTGDLDCSVSIILFCNKISLWVYLVVTIIVFIQQPILNTLKDVKYTNNHTKWQWLCIVYKKYTHFWNAFWYLISYKRSRYSPWYVGWKATIYGITIQTCPDLENKTYPNCLTSCIPPKGVAFLGKLFQVEVDCFQNVFRKIRSLCS